MNHFDPFPLTVRVSTGAIEGAAAETVRRIENESPSYAKDAIEVHVSTKAYSVSEWGSIMGHEMEYVRFYNENFIFRNSTQFNRSEVRAYQWQIDHSSHFNNPFSIDYLIEKRNSHQGF